MKNPSLLRVRSWAVSGLLLCALLLQAGASTAQQVPVRHVEGTSHGFLLLRSSKGKILATGDSTQIIKGDRVISRLVFRFVDGSIDDDRTVFSQKHYFRLISDHHLQKGPQFSHPMSVFINVPRSEVIVRTLGAEKNKDKTETHHLALPSDICNGMINTLLTNLLPNGPEAKFSYLAATPKPRIIQLLVDKEGDDTFAVGDTRHKAVRYVIKPRIGGVEGVIAPLVGKQPKDFRIWVLEGIAPAFVRMKGPLAEGGPVWEIRQVSPVWP